MENIKELKNIKFTENFYQFANRNDAQKYMKNNGFNCYKVIAEYAEFIEVIFGKGEE